MKEFEGERIAEIRTCATGYGIALLLTGGAFAAVQWQVLTPVHTLFIVLALGLVQMVVHFRFFLHLSFKKSARADLLLVLFSSLIIGLMVSGTLVVLMNLHARMM